MLLAGCWEAIFWWKVEAPALSWAFQLWSKQMGKKIGPHVVGAKLELYAVLISDHANGDNNGFGNVVSIPSSHQHARDGDKDISMMKQSQILINILNPDASCVAASTCVAKAHLCVHLSTLHDSGIVDKHVTFLLLVYRNISQIMKICT